MFLPSDWSSSRLFAIAFTRNDPSRFVRYRHIPHNYFIMSLDPPPRPIPNKVSLLSPTCFSYLNRHIRHVHYDLFCFPLTSFTTLDY